MRTTLLPILGNDCVLSAFVRWYLIPILGNGTLRREPRVYLIARAHAFWQSLFIIRYNLLGRVLCHQIFFTECHKGSHRDSTPLSQYG